ncbi:MAG: 4Fe-4S binding protein, partial [Methanothrix sp.]|nr:4Fe-4S binding protein [Methanothrix sp.]
MKNFINRQKLRKALIIFSFLLLPATFAYISCPIIIEAASKGIASGGLIIFILFFLSSLFLGRLWCGWLCPGGGLQEIYYIGSAEGHEYPNLQVGDEVDPRLSFCVNSKSINSCFF